MRLRAYCGRLSSPARRSCWQMKESLSISGTRRITNAQVRSMALANPARGPTCIRVPTIPSCPKALLPLGTLSSFYTLGCTERPSLAPANQRARCGGAPSRDRKSAIASLRGPRNGTLRNPPWPCLGTTSMRTHWTEQLPSCVPEKNHCWRFVRDYLAISTRYFYQKALTDRTLWMGHSDHENLRLNS